MVLRFGLGTRSTTSKIKDGRQLNISALENLSYRFDGLTALRKEGNYLIYYRVSDRTFGIYLKPSKIYHFKNSSIAELYFDELANSYRLYLDEHSNFFDAWAIYLFTDIESYMSGIGILPLLPII